MNPHYFTGRPMFGANQFQALDQTPIRIQIVGDQQQYAQAHSLFQVLVMATQARASIVMPDGTPVNPHHLARLTGQQPAVNYAYARPVEIEIDGDEDFHKAAVEYAADKKELEETQKKMMALQNKIAPMMYPPGAPISAIAPAYPGNPGAGYQPPGYFQQPSTPQERLAQATVLDVYTGLAHIGGQATMSRFGLDGLASAAFLTAYKRASKVRMDSKSDYGFTIVEQLEVSEDDLFGMLFSELVLPEEVTPTEE